jgi:hypothetical protein
MTATEKRIAKAETAIGVGERQHSVEVQMGHTQRLPASYVGERHVVTVSRLPNGHYEWEERPGPEPAEAETDPSLSGASLVMRVSGASLVMRVNFVGPPTAEPELQEPVASVAESKVEVPPADRDALARIHAAVTGPPQKLPLPQPERRGRPSPPLKLGPWNWA